MAATWEGRCACEVLLPTAAGWSEKGEKDGRCCQGEGKEAGRKKRRGRGEGREMNADSRPRQKNGENEKEGKENGWAAVGAERRRKRG